MNAADVYRLEALVELASVFPEPLTAGEIARRRRIPAAFLGRLLAGVARDGVVTTTRGPRGGVRLTRAPEDTRVAAILPEPPIPVSGSPAVAFLAGRLAAVHRELLERTTLAGLLAAEREHRADTDWQI